jgi:hypothetical protein
LRKQNFIVHFIFLSTGKATDKTAALIQKYGKDHQNKNVQFDVWDISRIRDEYVAVKSVEEQYPDWITFSLADKHILFPRGNFLTSRSLFAERD